MTGPLHGPRRSQHLPYPGDPLEDDPSSKPPAEPLADHGTHRRHGLMMLACCIPMLAVAVLLVITGIAGSGALVAALLCMGMMAMMMFAMPGGHGHR